ncbi:TIGR03084 family metal-binding protein [Actinomadura flavalba]|uniref:TIGR03084 family metal-binding protein n=1 Tax=Actinomadura flavalba TaxID=1120938 RepID=UPI000382F1C1|nr:TIGR03084 family metal-binding protein [Actinomadura flavalba]
MTDLQEVYADLAAEGEELDRVLSGLDDAAWATPTPAPGWTIAHQVAHMAATFRMAAMSAAEPEAFTAMVDGLGPDFDANVAGAMAPYLAEPPARLLERWRAELAASVKALGAVPQDQVVPWLVRPLPPAILACAGIMELIGHGQDVLDALGVQRTWTDRVKHLVGFAVVVKDFGYEAHGLTPPAEEFRWEIMLPSGTPWEFGPQDAANRVSGPAADFCLLVLRRRHRADVAVRAEGAEADRWLDIAQAYRGPAGPGRAAGQFAPLGG